MLTGIDSEVAHKLLNELMPGWEGDPGVVGTIRPQRSLFTAIAQHSSPLLDEFARVPGAADATQRLVVSIWQHAFRRELALSDIAIRNARTEKDESEIHYTIVNLRKSETFERPIVGRGSVSDFIERRSRQLEAAWLEVDGIREATTATVSALRYFALRYGFPINQVGMKDGIFRPNADGGDLRFTCYWSPPARSPQAPAVPSFN